MECPPTDAVINHILNDVISHPPTPPPVLSMQESGDTPPDYVRLLWLNALTDSLREELPVKDLTGWIVSTYPEKGTADALLGLSRLLFDPTMEVAFKTGKQKQYRTRDGVLECTTISITKASPAPGHGA